jgi:apolipoprotein N-acyltransferase
LGLVKLNHPSPHPPIGLKVAIVQSNQGYQEVNTLKKEVPFFKIVLARKILSQIKQAQALNPDLIVFSESVYPINLDSPKDYKEKMINDELREIIFQGKIPVLLGGHFNLVGKGITNGVMYFKPGEKLVEQKFFKNKLFPFGEHVPGREFIPFTLPTVDLNTAGEIIKGEIKGKTFAVLICYETIVPSYVKEVVELLRPDFIINPTNETYFDTFGEPQLALALTSFRAAEVKLPILRVGNTGISAIINSNGEIKEKWPMNQELIKLINF